MDLQLLVCGKLAVSDRQFVRESWMGSVNIFPQFSPLNPGALLCLWLIKSNVNIFWSDTWNSALLELHLLIKQ